MSETVDFETLPREWATYLETPMNYPTPHELQEQEGQKRVDQLVSNP